MTKKFNNFSLTIFKKYLLSSKSNNGSYKKLQLEVSRKTKESTELLKSSSKKTLKKEKKSSRSNLKNKFKKNNLKKRK
jgi:hypothetical protein